MVHRICSIDISNDCSIFTLVNPRVYTESGCCEVPLPPTLTPSASGNALFRKSEGAARGAVGVFTYDLFNLQRNDSTQCLAVMFSVPYDRNLYSNWFAVGVLDRGTECDANLYDQMYEGNESQFVRGKADGSCITYGSDCLTVRASMSDCGEASLKVEVVNQMSYGY